LFLSLSLSLSLSLLSLSLSFYYRSEDQGAAAWIQRTKEQASRIEKEMEEIEQQSLKNSARENNNKHAKYGSRDLAGLTVKHDLKEVLQHADEDLVLTLADEPILKRDEGKSEYEINEEGNQLENVMLSERQRIQENLDRKKKKPTYNALDDTKKNILSQYDEPEEKPVFTLGEGLFFSKIIIIIIILFLT